MDTGTIKEIHTVAACFHRKQFNNLDKTDGHKAHPYSGHGIPQGEASHCRAATPIPIPLNEVGVGRDLTRRLFTN